MKLVKHEVNGGHFNGDRLFIKVDQLKVFSGKRIGIFVYYNPLICGYNNDSL